MPAPFLELGLLELVRRVIRPWSRRVEKQASTTTQHVSNNTVYIDAYEEVVRMGLPTLLAPLDEDRRQLVAVLDLLAVASEPETRADLAGELVRLSARYEDAKERALYPALRGQPGTEAPIARAEEDQAAVRSAMVEIRNRTRHVKPINTHADDAEGFEASL